MPSSRIESHEDSLIRPTTPDRWPRGIACSGGFSVLGTPLRFRGAKGAGLRFVSHVDEELPRKGHRILLAPFTQAAIGAETRGLDALTLGFDRTIRLGRMDIRLHPAGLGPGSSQLEIEFRGRRILYCGGIRTTQPLASPPADFPKCDLLLLDAPPVAPRPPAAKRTSKALLKEIAQCLDSKRSPVIACGSWAAFFEVAWSLRSSNVPVRVCRPGYQSLRRVATLGFSAPNFQRLEQKWPTLGVILHTSALWPRTKFSRTETPSVFFAGSQADVPDWCDMAFRMGESEDRAGLVEYAKNVDPKQIALSPRCDPSLVKALQKAGFDTFQVQAPIQIPLPF